MSLERLGAVLLNGGVRAEHDAERLHAIRVLESESVAGRADGVSVLCADRLGDEHSTLVHAQREAELRSHLANPVECSEHVLLRSNESEIVLDADRVCVGQTSDGALVHGLHEEGEHERSERVALSHAF